MVTLCCWYFIKPEKVFLSGYIFKISTSWKGWRISFNWCINDTIHSLIIIFFLFQNDYDSMDYTEYSHSPHHPGTTPERPSSRSSQQQLRAAHPGWYPPPPPHIMPPFPPAPPVWGMAPYQTVSCKVIEESWLNCNCTCWTPLIYLHPVNTKL